MHHFASNSISIAKTSDIKELTKIQIIGWKHSYKNILSKAFLNSLSEKKIEEDWCKKIESGSEIYTFKVDAQIVGYIDLGESRDANYPKETWGQIHGLYILPQYQGRRIGKMLFTEAEHSLVRLGFTKLFCWVFEENQKAIQFYVQRGMKEEGRTIGPFTGDEKDIPVRILSKNI